MGHVYTETPSENLSVPVRFEPQSMHWHHGQVTVYSGILKTQGAKSYHSYISDDHTHDQQFVYVALKKMLEGKNVDAGAYVVIESDNCSSQYKSAEHFFTVQQISNQLDAEVVRVFGISEHGKGEVDHVGGIAKNTVRKEIAGGRNLQTSAEMVKFLSEKFADKSSPEYVVRGIGKEEFDEARSDVAHKVFKTIHGSSLFQVIVFEPFSSNIKASKRLCLCNLCKVEYGSCSLFENDQLTIQTLKDTALRSSRVESKTGQLAVANNTNSEFLLLGSFCAIAASNSSADTVWFLLIDREVKEATDITDDDYGHCILVCQKYLIQRFLKYD